MKLRRTLAAAALSATAVLTPAASAACVDATVGGPGVDTCPQPPSGTLCVERDVDPGVLVHVAVCVP